MSGFLIFRRVLALLLLIGTGVLLVQLVGDLNRVKTLKIHLAEMNHVRYGLLDADQWVLRVSAIIEKRVDQFELTESNRPQIVRAVAQVLDTLLVEIERYLRRRNLATGGTWLDQLQGTLQQGLQDLLVDFDRLRAKVPQYAEAVVEQLSRPEAKQEIKHQLLALLRQASDSTFGEIDRSRLTVLLQRHGCMDREDCSRRLRAAISEAQLPLRQQFGGLLGLVGLLFLICLSERGRHGPSDPVAPRRCGSPNQAQFPGLASTRNQVLGLDPFALLVLTGAILILLAGGLLTPMIEIEARIDELKVSLLGEPLVFSHQVLYYQTKSIFEVVRILAETRRAEMLLVALLLTLFSVIFPLLKVMATYLYYYDLGRVGASGWIRFFALRSGKWSMADVFVVAIFMAYMGFDGLVANQLGSLAQTGQGVELLTTNGTSLEPGFYLFLCFVLASLLLSALLERGGETGRPSERAWPHANP